MMTKTDVVFEVSFEVCNKVGGIYNVIKSKAAQMMKKYKNYYAIGPYYPDKAAKETIKQEPPDFIQNVFSKLEARGIKCYYGTWMIKGKPKVILVDPNALMGKVDDIKTELWEKYQVDSLEASHDFDEPVAWSRAVGILLEQLVPFFKQRKIVCHFHEWLSGTALLYLKDKVPTVFTTHATMLGRSMAGSGENFHEHMTESLKENKTVDPKKAKKYNVQAKYTLERATAQNCTVFTTVSEVTSKEAKYILGKEADVIVANGLDMSNFPTMEEFALYHRRYREKIKNFLGSYFGPYQKPDLSDSMIFFTAGRYEFRNKGFDILIESLGKLNDHMKKNKINKNIFAFFFVPRGEVKENVELLQNLMLYEAIEEQIEDEMPQLKEKVMRSIISGKMPKIKKIFSEEFLEDTRKNILSFKRKGAPPLSALLIGGEDDILNAFKNNGLLNNEKDKVKVIFYPSYLSTDDRLLGLSYEQAIQGSHLGIFPSYYEPWGYTPLETAANGVMSITSDYAGFGLFIEPHLKSKSGIMVLKRDGKEKEQIVNDLFKMMLTVVKMERPLRIPKKAEAKELAALADWKFLIENYVKAHDLAIETFKK